MSAEDEIITLKARLRLLEAMVRVLVSTAPPSVFNAIVEALETPEVVEGHPDLAREIDERRQLLAHELRRFREDLEAGRGVADS